MTMVDPHVFMPELYETFPRHKRASWETITGIPQRPFCGNLCDKELVAHDV